MKILATFITLLVTSTAVMGQTESTENSNIWTGISVERKLSDNLKFNFDQQFRWNKLDIQNRSSFLEAGLKYRISKHFNTKLQYRYTARNDQRNIQRFTLDLGTKWKIKPVDHLSLKLRTRFQNATVSYTGQQITYLRNRASLEYEFAKKWETSISYENFFRLNQRNEIRAHRYRWKLNYEFSKRLNMDLFFQFEQEVNKKNTQDAKVVGLLLNWELKHRNKK